MKHPTFNKDDPNEKLFGMVPSIAQKFKFHDPNDFDDAISIGFCTVAYAMKKYEQIKKPTAKVETYVFVAVRNEIARFFDSVVKWNTKREPFNYNTQSRDDNYNDHINTLQQRYASIYCFLNDFQRKVINLRLQKLTPAEIARKLDCSRPVIRNTLTKIYSIINRWNSAGN
jgi:RNA polymerase sigma factor (sigma-70 family)